MPHSCGQSHYQLNLNSADFSIDTNQIENYIAPSLSSVSRQLYSSYLGPVTVDVTVSGDTALLEKYHPIGGKQLLIKVVNAQEHNLSDKLQYSLQKLKSLSAQKINLSKNKYYYALTLLCNKKLAQLNQNSQLVSKIELELSPFLRDTTIMTQASSTYPELVSATPTKSVTDYKKIYQTVVQHNSSVDVFFNTSNYLDFLFTTTKMISVNNLDSLVSISNVPNLDNAFFTGQYMVYGNGNTAFYPLSSMDVVGHELSHGLVSGTAGLEYKGHSGALNESYADIMGTMFEFYMYEKYPDLAGTKDWLIGEDLGMGMPFLRSL